MNQAVIIACAGWKGAGKGTEYVHLPAPFLPLPDGTDAASRLAAQFGRQGYDIFLTVGPLGYPYSACQPRHECRYADLSGEEAARALGVEPADTPWTPELHGYASTLGKLIVQPDPGWKTKHDSYCIALDAMSNAYDHIVLIRGDKLYKEWFLARVLRESPWPSQFDLETWHSIFLLDRVGVGIYRADAQNHRQRSTARQNWGQEMAKQPDGGEGTGRLARAGIPHITFDDLPWMTVDGRSLWADMDRPPGYALARQWVREGRFA